MNYVSQLKTEEWKIKRNLILKRDQFKCKNCGSSENLHIHHKVYEKGLKAWEAKNENLITLCSECHAKEHDKKPISSFYNTKKVSKSKLQNRNNKIKLQMKKSRKDQNNFNNFGF